MNLKYVFDAGAPWYVLNKTWYFWGMVRPDYKSTHPQLFIIYTHGLPHSSNTLVYTHDLPHLSYSLSNNHGLHILLHIRVHVCLQVVRFDRVTEDAHNIVIEKNN